MCLFAKTSVQYDFPPPQKRVVREENKLLSMMPLSATNKANRTLLYSIQEEVSSDLHVFLNVMYIGLERENFFSLGL